TGIILSPEVVPDVLTQSRQRPGHVTPRAPAAARSQRVLKSLYSRTGTRSWYWDTVRMLRNPCVSPNSVPAAAPRRERSATSWPATGSPHAPPGRRRRTPAYQPSAAAIIEPPPPARASAVFASRRATPPPPR